MKKLIIAGITVIACVALCAAVWPRNAEAGDLPPETVKTAVSTEIEAQSEEISEIILSDNSSALGIEAVAENEPPKTEVTSEEKTESPAPRTISKSESVSTEPKSGEITVIDGNRCMWVPGFGWIEDNGRGNVGIVAEDMYENGNKIGSMD